MMWKLYCKEGWMSKNWCFQIVLLEKGTLESPLDTKEIKSVNPKRNQSWIFFGRASAKAEVPVLWPPDAKSWLTGKDSDAGKDWSQKRRGQQRMRWLESMVDSMDRNLSKLREIVANRGAWYDVVHGVAKCQSQLSCWITSCYQSFLRDFVILFVPSYTQQVTIYFNLQMHIDRFNHFIRFIA